MDHTIVMGTLPAGGVPGRAKPNRVLIEVWDGAAPAPLVIAEATSFDVEGTIIGDGRVWTGARYTVVDRDCRRRHLGRHADPPGRRGAAGDRTVDVIDRTASVTGRDRRGRRPPASPRAEPGGGARRARRAVRRRRLPAELQRHRRARRDLASLAVPLLRRHRRPQPRGHRAPARRGPPAPRRRRGSRRADGRQDRAPRRGARCACSRRSHRRPVSARVCGHRHPVVAAQLRESRSYLRHQIRRLFAGELEGDRAALLPAIDALCSFETYELLRFDQGLSRSKTVSALVGALTTLLDPRLSPRRA